MQYTYYILWSRGIFLKIGKKPIRLNFRLKNCSDVFYILPNILNWEILNRIKGKYLTPVPHAYLCFFIKNALKKLLNTNWSPHVIYLQYFYKFYREVGDVKLQHEVIEDPRYQGLDQGDRTKVGFHVSLALYYRFWDL